MARDCRESTGEDHGYLIEFVRIGNSTKVSAIDPATGVEVSIVGPTSAGEAILSRNAVAKLTRRLQAQSQSGS
jgi:hypothetical protein